MAVDLKNTFRREVPELWNLARQAEPLSGLLSKHSAQRSTARSSRQLIMHRTLPSGNVCRVIALDGRKVSNLKRAVNRIVGEEFPGAWITTTDCICALVWVAVMRARYHRLPADAITTFTTAVDARKRVHGIPSTFFGNMFVQAHARAILGELVGARKRLVTVFQLLPAPFIWNKADTSPPGKTELPTPWFAHHAGLEKNSSSAIQTGRKWDRDP